MDTYRINDVFGLSRDIPLNYIERQSVDTKLKRNLDRSKHITIFGSSKQGKTCLRKHCLTPDQYILVSCNNKWSISDLNSHILKQAGYEITDTTTRTVGGEAKIVASVEVGIPLLGKGDVEGDANITGEQETSKHRLELDLADVNDIVSALKEIGFNKYIILEDFHYLKVETQRDFSFALKAFHENSTFCFIIVGVWLDENRLSVYNGDLTGRLIPINADNWTDDELKQVIDRGADLLNVRFDDQFISSLVKACLGNVYIVQEACHRACEREGVTQTVTQKKLICRDQNAEEIIRELIQEQSGRYNAFISSYANGFQDTTLEMHKWLLYPILTSNIDELSSGLKYKAVRTTLQRVHPRKEELNAGNLTQALKAVVSLQQTKNIQPIILDYDESNRTLHVVDRGFLIWLSTQDRDDLLASIDLPECGQTEEQLSIPLS